MPLTETRKADRAQMAALLAAAALDAGAASAEVEAESADRADFSFRTTRVKLDAGRGLRLTATFRADTPQARPDTHVLSWHMNSSSDARLRRDFAGYDGVNPHHRTKATQTCEGFDALVELVTAGVRKAADGSAFDPEREAADIAADGTAAYRNARFAVWRALDDVARTVRDVDLERETVAALALADRPDADLVARAWAASLRSEREHLRPARKARAAPVEVAA